MMFRIIAVAMLCTVLAGSAAGEDRALLVGINDYRHWPDRRLAGPANDVRLMAEIAEKVWRFEPHQIRVLLDEKATAAAVLASLDDWLVAGTRPGDRVLFYFGGHGYYVRDLDGDEPTGFDQILAGHDVERRGEEFANTILDDDIAARLRRLEGRTVMLVVDSCHSGTITRALDPLRTVGPSVVRSLSEPALTRSVGREEYDRLRRQTFLPAFEHVLAWTAAASSELAEEDMSLPAERRHGVFTRAFADGLLHGRADGNGNGTITPAELLAHVRGKVREYCTRHPCRTGMTPTLEWPKQFARLDLLRWGPTGGPSSAPAPTERPPLQPSDFLPAGEAEGVTEIELLPGPGFAVGESMRLRITAREAGYLVVFDVRENGRVIQLFPSRCSRHERYLRAGATVTLPDPTYGCEFAATEPGRGQIVAIVTRDRLPIDLPLARYRDLEVVPKQEDYLMGIVQQILGVWTGDERSRPVKWAVAAASYEVSGR